MKSSSRLQDEMEIMAQLGRDLARQGNPRRRVRIEHIQDKNDAVVTRVLDDAWDDIWKDLDRSDYDRKE